MLHLAMIGAGGYAFELIKRIWMIPDKIELVAVTSNPSRKRPGAEICREKGVEVFDGVDELLKKMQGRCEVIFVPTPIHTHSPLTKKCLNAGFDVFMEKPPTATIQWAFYMVAWACSMRDLAASGVPERGLQAGRGHGRGLGDFGHRGLP